MILKYPFLAAAWFLSWVSLGVKNTILYPWCRQEAKLEEEAGRGRGLSYLVLWAEQYRLRVPAWEGTGQDLQVEIFQGCVSVFIFYGTGSIIAKKLYFRIQLRILRFRMSQFAKNIDFV